MKKTLRFICSIAMVSILSLSFSACTKNESTKSDSSNASSTSDEAKQSENDKLKIGIVQLVEHASLDASCQGFIAALADNGYIDGENIEIDFQNAQNDQSNLKTISQRFVQNNSDLILAIATPAAQTIATETTEIPILGTAITDYIEAGLVESNDSPNGNVSGTSDRTPVKEQLELLKQILPDAKTVGIMYNSGEVNSEIQAKLAQDACDELGLSYELGTVTNTNDIAQVLQSIVSKVDALYIPTDNTFASAMATVGAISEESKVPAITGATGMTEVGGLATVGIDYFKLGYQTGEMAVRILKGEDVSKMPVEFTADADIIVNLDIAKATGIEIPSDIVDKAKIIVENGIKSEK